jgi:hypothetical protein
LSIISFNLRQDTFKVLLSTSTGTTCKPRAINGIGLVDQVRAEKAEASPFFILHKFKRAWINAKFAELPELKIIQSFLP